MVVVMNVVHVDEERREAFDAWVDSDLFKLSHRHADGELAIGSEVRNYEVIDVKVPA